MFIYSSIYIIIKMIKMFVDNLALELLILFITGMLILYTTIVYFKNRKAKETINVIPLLILGIFIFIIGIIEEIMWPLPKSYNILFYDPFILFGMILIAFTTSILLKQKLHYVGFFSLISGAIVIVYGVSGCILNMTRSPMMLLGLFGFFGLSGIFAYPVALMYDYKKSSKAYEFMLALFLIFLIIAILLALLLGVVALHGHLLATP